MYLVRIKYLFFLTIFFVGIFIYKDYGISWDEKISRNYGLVSGNYILKKILFLLILKRVKILIFYINRLKLFFLILTLHSIFDIFDQNIL